MREVRLYQSLVRPHLLMGAERQATLLNAGFAMLVYFFTMSLPGIVVAVVLFSITQAVLQHLAKNDAQMIAIVQRSRKYQPFYGDGASLDAPYRDVPQFHTVAPTTKLLSWFTKAGKTKTQKSKVIAET
ncbi:VirB3 family type IV secretion system protein [Acidithiobacillus caldus]|uniref:VirB3 family type IV secretion system protein n=1 Tax=Acidithiobacillus caldus TaxID=33059 RepID=UPI000B105B07|nr:VirB3 family type IV secretion system protein [Acidithiobacillus caldus]